MNLSIGSVKYAGAEGYYGSGSAYSSSEGSFFLWFDSENVASSNSTRRWTGFTVQPE